MRQTRRVASLLICLLVGAPAAIHGLSDVPASAEIQEDTAGQVTINDDPTSNTTDTQLSISATIFSGVPGPRECRGSVMATLDVAPPPAGGGRTAAACYNLPSPAGCGNFVANKADGCEARLFAEPNCAMYTNTAVFIPEPRAVGGRWRSISVQCGIPPPDPDSLGKPPLADLMTNVKKGPKSARARRSAADAVDAAAAAAAAVLP